MTLWSSKSGSVRCVLVIQKKEW